MSGMSRGLEKSITRWADSVSMVIARMQQI
jgi:hypothetical protein